MDAASTRHVLTTATLCCTAHRQRHSTDCSEANADPCRHAEHQPHQRQSSVTVASLPISERIKYKVVSLTFKARRTSTPAYLHSLLNDYVAPCIFQSSSTLQLIILRTCAELAEHMFSVTTPTVWNGLPMMLLMLTVCILLINT